MKNLVRRDTMRVIFSMRKKNSRTKSRGWKIAIHISSDLKMIFKRDNSKSIK